MTTTEPEKRIERQLKALRIDWTDPIQSKFLVTQLLLTITKEALADVERLKKELEQERVRLAGCGVAALGYGEELSKDSYGFSASYQDVLNLRKKYESEVERLKKGSPDTSCLAWLLDKWQAGDTGRNLCPI